MANTNIDISRGMVLVDKDTKRPYVVDKIDWNDDSNDNNTVVHMDLYSSGELRHEKITFNYGDLSAVIANKYLILITDTDFKDNTWSIEWDLFNKLDIDVYPVTIKSDRYNGTYNGGYNFTAWSCEEEDIPEDIDGCDVECAKAWHHVKEDMRLMVGFGRTPSVALLDVWFKQYGIDVEDYKPKASVEVKGNKVVIIPVNERPVEIDMKTAELISKAISSGEALQEKYHNLLSAIRDDAVNDDDTVEDSDDNPEDTALIDPGDISVVAELIANDIEEWNHSNGTDFEVIISEGELSNVEVRIVDIRLPKLTTTLYWRREWTYGYFSDNYLFKALQELTT